MRVLQALSLLSAGGRSGEEMEEKGDRYQETCGMGGNKEGRMKGPHPL